MPTGHTLIDFLFLYVILALAALGLYMIERRRRSPARAMRGRTRVTIEGMIFSALSCVMLAAAVNTRINLLYLISGVMFSAIMLSALLVRALLKVKVERVVPEMVAAGEEVVVRLTLSNGRRFRPVFALIVQDSVEPVVPGAPAVVLPPADMPMLEPQNSRLVTYRCRFPRRGVYRFGQIVIKSRFPLGFIEILQRHELVQEVAVHPAIGSIRELPLDYHPHYEPAAVAHRYSSGEEEFSHLRDYRPGDNPRRIHWRTSARLRELHVMQFQSSPSRAADVILDPALSSDTPETRGHFERAAAFAATLVSHLARRGYHLKFSFNGAACISGSAAMVLPEVLDALARVTPQVSLPVQLNDTNGGFRILVAAEGKCSTGAARFVAAAADDELQRWFCEHETVRSRTP